ncbi:MAG: hypothetical protein ACX94C_10595 [Phycisphaerales bacterium]
MTEKVRVRIRDGEFEIEAEGPQSFVQETVAEWVESVKNGIEQRVKDKKPATRKSSGKTKQSGSKTSKRAVPKDAEDDFDSQTLVNQIREDGQCEMFERKVLDARSRINKAKLILWYADRHLTTGQIAKVLSGLGVKIGTPGISTAINNHLNDFLQDGTRTKGAVIKYKLTGKSAREFTKWLEADE